MLYKSMRECLIYLTHLDQQSTQVIMVEKLEKQVGLTFRVLLVLDPFFDASRLTGGRH